MLSSRRLIGLTLITGLFHNACGGGTGASDTEPVAASQERLVVAAPARILGQNYVRFQESTPANQGGQCDRGDGVDMELTSDLNGGKCNIGWTTPGEWLEYDISVASASVFNISARVASANAGQTFHIELDGVNLGSLTSPAAGWQAFADRSYSNVNVGAGSHVLRIAFDSGNVNLNYIDVTAAVVAPTCTDGVQNGTETGVDCGGSCPVCQTTTTCTEQALSRASATASSQETAAFPASLAIDGDTTTRWSSAFSDPQWIYVDLGASRHISRVALNWETAASKNYEIGVSDSASGPWNVVASTTTGDGGIDNLSFTPVTGRFVRMNSTARTTQWGNSLFEFQIFGDPNPNCGTTSTTDTVPPLSQWQPISTSWPVDANIMVMTDGTLIGFRYFDGAVFSLAPSTTTGGYDSSTWNPLASMHDSRLYFGSHILPDGRVFVVGGEYGSGTNKGEVYDPLANTWSTPFATTAADTETALLPDGRVYISWSSSIYDPQTGSLSAGPQYPGNYDEAGFVLLTDQSYLTIPAFSNQAYRYVPSSGSFVPAGIIPGTGLYDGKQEIGPGVLLPSGKVLWLGANGNTAIYTPPSNASDPGSWVEGPRNPDGYGADDAPAVVLRNGNVLFLADVGGSGYVGPTKFYLYNPTTNTISAGSDAFPDAVYGSRLLPLPNGQVLLSFGGTGYLYTPPAGGTAWAPTISTITPVSSGVYQLAGTNLNGVTEGASYGDDAEMSSNFPLVRFQCGGGTTIRYARTFGWAPAVVGASSIQRTTRFQVPADLNGACSLFVVANGIPSAAKSVTVTNGVLSGI